MLNLDTKLPEFNLLNTVNNKNFNSNLLPKDKGKLIMFICNHCPYVIHYHEEIIKLADDFKNDINLVVYNNMNKVVDKYKVSVKDNLDRILTYDDLIKEKNNLKIYYIFKLKLIGKINYSIYIE